jgi:hypothetical protein
MGRAIVVDERIDGLASVYAIDDHTCRHPDAGDGRMPETDARIENHGTGVSPIWEQAEGIEYRAGTFPFSANGRARALGESAGLVKLLAHAQSDEILGVHVMGPFAGELIAEAVVAMEFRGSAEDLGMICHAHPTLSEAMKEAALAVDKRALNL